MGSSGPQTTAAERRRSIEAVRRMLADEPVSLRPAEEAALRGGLTNVQMDWLAKLRYAGTPIDDVPTATYDALTEKGLARGGVLTRAGAVLAVLLESVQLETT